MKHKELVSELAGRTGWALDDVGGILSALALEIGTRLVDNKVVCFPGLGQFEAEKELEHISVDANGKRYLIPPKLKPIFKPVEKDKGEGDVLTIKELATAVAVHTGKNKDSAEQFLQAFSALVAEAIRLGQEVEVKGLGTFKPASPEGKLCFIPAKELESAVNKPFSFFEITELNEGVHFPDLEETVQEVSEPAPEVSEAPDEIQEEKMEPQAIPAEKEESFPTTPAPLAEEKESESPRRYPWWGVALLLLVVLGVGLYGIFSLEDKDTKAVLLTARDTISVDADTVLVETPDTLEIKAVEPEPPKEIGKDTIAPGDMLTTIALKYYGHKIFWVYLFDYNKGIVKDPNNIPIGTEIRIPARELYGIDPHKAESREEAARLQTEILTKNK